MKKSTLLLTLIALSGCSTNIESKSSKLASEPVSYRDPSVTVYNEGSNRRDNDIFIQNQTIIGGELLTRKDRGREADIVPQLSERMKFGNYLPYTVNQLPWTYGIKIQVLV